MYVIVGFGDVGSTLYCNAQHVLPHLVVDPQYPEYSSWDHIATRNDIEGVIVCVSTPVYEHTRDLGNIRDVLRRVTRHCPWAPVLIVRELTTNEWRSLSSTFSHLRLTHGPNFLITDDTEDAYLWRGYLSFTSTTTVDIDHAHL